MTAPHDPETSFAAEVRAAWEGCAVDGPTWPQEVRRLGEQVLAVLLEVGLPAYGHRPRGYGTGTGVQLALEGAGFTVGVTLLWRQHPRSEAGMPGDPWRIQQEALYQALRTILQARGFRLLADTGAAPVVIGARSA